MPKRMLTLVLLLVILSACNGAGPNRPTDTAPVAPLSPTQTPTTSPVPPTDTAAPTESPVPDPVITDTPALSFGPENFPPNINPLTGLEASDPTILDRRPLSVKVQIFPRGQRPPMGVSQADIVYDYYQNNGMTRFHTVFYGQNSEQVGPIRSARLFDRHVVWMYKSILAFGGADSRILSTIFSSDFSDRLVMENSFNCPPMCRVDPNGYNFLVTNTSELSQFITSKGVSNTRQDLNGMLFHASPLGNGAPGTQVFVRFSISAYTRWDYDAGSGHYLRFQDTQETASWEQEAYAEMVDRNTGQQLTANNVVILFLPHKFRYRSASGTSEIVEIDLAGSGPAYAFRDGQMYQVNWNRPGKESVLFLTLPDGTPYPFKPGNTWYEVIGQSSTTEDVGGGVWRFLFKIP